MGGASLAGVVLGALLGAAVAPPSGTRSIRRPRGAVGCRASAATAAWGTCPRESDWAEPGPRHITPTLLAVVFAAIAVAALAALLVNIFTRKQEAQNPF